MMDSDDPWRIRRASSCSKQLRVFFDIHDDDEKGPLQHIAHISDSDDCSDHRTTKRPRLRLHAEELEDDKRAKLVDSWLSVLMLNPKATKTGIFVEKRNDRENTAD